MTEDADSNVTTYARIATTDMQTPRDMLEFWQEPMSFFIMSGAITCQIVTAPLSRA